MATQLDPDGWQYTTRLDSAYWYPKNDSALCKLLGWLVTCAAIVPEAVRFVFGVSCADVLRRRTWSRDLRKAPKGSKKLGK